MSGAAQVQTGVGAIGLAGGIASLYGPPIVLFWLSGKSSAGIVRYNIFAYFGLISVVAAVSYWMNSLFTIYSLLLAALAMPAYAVPFFWGASFLAWPAKRNFVIWPRSYAGPYRSLHCRCGNRRFESQPS